MKEKIMNGLLMFATKLQQQRHMAAIKNGFTTLLPIIIVGSFCTLFSNTICNTTPGYVSVANIPGMSWLGALKPLFDAANWGTMNMLAICGCFLIAAELGKAYNENNLALPATAIACYISLVSTTATGTASNGELVTINNVITNDVTSARGLFVAMVAALASAEIYCRLVKSGKLEIKMPESVPSNVAKSFSVLFPACLTVFAISGFNLLFTTITGMSVPAAIVTFIQAPLANVMTSWFGYVILVFVSDVLWLFGIHGTNTLSGIYQPILLAAFAENEAAYSAGEAIPNIICTPFLNNFATITGAGITGGLLIAIFLFSKREDFKAIAKLAAPCAIFNINEPLIFGLPIVMNPMLAIPFILAPAASNIFAYFMTTIGFCGRFVVNAPWTTPPMLMGFLSSGGNIGAAITQLLVILIATVIYTPFVIILNRQKPEGADEVAE